MRSGHGPIPSGNTQHKNDMMRDAIFFAEQLFPDTAIMVSSVSDIRPLYMGSNCEQVLGHEFSLLKRMDWPDIFSFIHPGDQAAVQHCIGTEGILKVKPGYRTVLYYRYSDQDGTYHLLRDERVCMKTGQHSLVRFVIVSRVHAPCEEFDKVRMEIFKEVENGVEKISDYFPVSPVKMSRC